MLIYSLIYSLLLIATHDKFNPDKSKIYTGQINADITSKLLAELPNGSEIKISQSNDNQIHASVTITFRDNDADEGLKRLPNISNILSNSGRTIVLDLKEIKKSLMIEESNGIIDKLFNAIKGKNQQYYTENGVRYLIISHYMKVELQIPKIDQFNLSNKYGLIDFNQIQINSFEVNAHSSETIGSNFTGSLDLSNKYSTLKLENMNGEIELECHEMDIDIKNITGSVTIANKYSPTRVKEVTGNLNLKLHSSKADISQISGAVFIEDKYAQVIVKKVNSNFIAQLHESDLTAEDIDGFAEISNKYSPVKLINVNGYVKLDLHQSRLTLEKVHGNVNLTNKYESNSISNVYGDLTIEAHEAELSIKRITGDLTAANKYKETTAFNIGGTVKLTLHTSKLKLDSVGRKTEITNKYGDNVVTRIFSDLTLTSHEGNNTIEQVTGNLKLDAKYSEGSIKNVTGEVTIKAHQHPLKIVNIGSLKLNGKYTPLTLSGNLKSIDIENHEGEISVQVNKDYNHDIRISSKYDDIKILGLNLDLYRLDLRCKSGKIRSRKLSDDFEDDDDSDRFRRNWSDKSRPTLELSNHSANIILD